MFPEGAAYVRPGTGMPFPWTLQRYIFREMSKTFALTAIGLTGVLGLGGGIMNMVELGEVTPGQLLRLLGLVLPLAAALTLPVAALFAATSTYGRLSADNEFVACRSSGINLHVLFVPTLALSLLAGGISFGVTNYVIPGMVRNLDAFIRADLGAMIRQQLNRPRGFKLNDKYRVYADESFTDPTNSDRITLRGVAFVELDVDNWVRYGTFRELQIDLDQASRPPQLTAVAYGISWFDRKAGQFSDYERQVISSQAMPSLVPPKIKFLNLDELFHFLAHPAEWDEVRASMDQLRIAEGRTQVFQRMFDAWKKDKRISLVDDSVAYDITAQEAALEKDGSGLQLFNVQIEDRTKHQQVHADRAVMEVTRGDTLDESGIRIQLYTVGVSDGVTTIARDKYALPPVMIDTEVLARIKALSDDQLLAARDEPAGDPTSRKRKEAREARAATVRRVLGTINERAAFSASIFVLVILGAALAIIFRGAHVMTAFGISFVPSLVVIVGIVAGKQMAQNVDTQVLGLSIMWSGMLLVACLDAWTLTRVLRR